jgi:hypothetical protein
VAISASSIAEATTGQQAAPEEDCACPADNEPRAVARPSGDALPGDFKSFGFEGKGAASSGELGALGLPQLSITNVAPTTGSPLATVYVK